MLWPIGALLLVSCACETNPIKSRALSSSDGPVTAAPRLSAALPAPTPDAAAAVPGAASIPVAAPPGSHAIRAPATRAPLCEVVANGLTILRPCTGAAGEVRSSSTARARPKCLVTTTDGLTLVRDCEGAKGERPAQPDASH